MFYSLAKRPKRNSGISQTYTTLSVSCFYLLGLGSWDETMASRGSQEISSRVIKHLLSRAAYCNHVVMYGNTCTGQNRNWNFALSMKILTLMNTTNINTIDLKYMVKGHLYLLNDTDCFHRVSCKKENASNLFSQWVEKAILKFRNKNKFHVTSMNSRRFQIN